MLPSAEFICLRIAYREALSEEQVYMKGALNTAAIAVWVQVTFFHSLPSRVRFSFQGELFFSFWNCFSSILLDIIFLPALQSRTVYSLVLHLDPREKISSPM